MTPSVSPNHSYWESLRGYSQKEDQSPEGTCILDKEKKNMTTRDLLNVALLLIHLIYNGKNYHKFSYILKDVYFINHN